MPRLCAGLVLFLLSWPSAAALADPYPRQPAIDIQHYTFRLSLDDASDEIRGETTVHVRFVRTGVTTVALDLVGREADTTGMTVVSVTRDGRPVSFTHAGDRLTITLGTPPAAGERRQFTIAYHGAPADGLIIANNRYGDRTFFGDNFPDRARYWLPTLDHPSDKATCDFVITAPAHYQAIASGRLVEETSLPDGLRLTHWRTSAPTSTYLMVVGVARFAVQHVERLDGVPIQTWVYPQDRDAGFFDFSRTRRVLEFFRERIGPYSYEKLANVQSTTRYGGMENAGTIFYGERVVTGSRRVEGTVVHEVAHQWFGDAVTEADWNHVWLSEGFATYFTHLFDEWAFGRDRLNSGMARDRDTVARVRRSSPDLRIVDERVPIREVLSAYTYQKGGWVLHMLRRKIGDDAFWLGVRAYHERYRNATALSEDVQREMEVASGQDLSVFFRQWLYEPGHPALDVSWRHDAARRVIDLTVEQTQDSPVFVFDLDVGVTMADGARRVETVSVSQRSQTFTISSTAEPAAIMLDPDVWLLFEGAVEQDQPRPEGPGHTLARR